MRHAGEAQGEPRILALKLAADFFGNSLYQCQAPEDFDKVEEAVKNGIVGTDDDDW